MNFIKLFITIVTLSITLTAYGQRGNGERYQNKIESEMIGFLTQQLELTPDQAQEFFPEYREHKAQERELRKNMLPKKRLDDLSDEESSALLDNIMNIKDELHELEKQYMVRYRTILESKQVVALLKAEKEFKQRLIRNISERKKERRSKRSLGN